MKVLIVFSLLMCQLVQAQILTEYKAPSGKVFKAGDTIRVIGPADRRFGEFKSIISLLDGGKPLFSTTRFNHGTSFQLHPNGVELKDYRNRTLPPIKYFYIESGDTLARLKGLTPYIVNIKMGEELNEIYTNTPYTKRVDLEAMGNFFGYLSTLMPDSIQEELLYEYQFYHNISENYMRYTLDSYIGRFKDAKLKGIEEMKDGNITISMRLYSKELKDTIVIDQRGFGPLLHQNYEIKKDGLYSENVKRHNIMFKPDNRLTIPLNKDFMKYARMDTDHIYLILNLDVNEIRMADTRIIVDVHINYVQAWAHEEDSYLIGYR